MSAVAPARRSTWHDAFDAQMQLWRWTRPDAPGASWLRKAFRVSTEGLSEESKKLSAQLYASINRIIFDADPIYVSGEMCELVEAARHSFDLEALLPTDLITAHGFLYFEQPLVMPDKHGTDTEICAVAWAPIIGSNDRTRGDEFVGMHDPLAYFKGRDYTDVWAGDPDGDASEVDGIAVVLFSPTVEGSWAHDNGAKMVPIHATPWWFGMGFDGNDRDENGEFTGAQWWWRLSQTTFRLMMQQISHRVNHRPDRPTRRDAKRRGFHEKDVVVVRLRRERDDDLPGGPHEDARYSHRFIVGGHWRSQWYPASAVHRQIWISPYVKGSADLPLLVKPRRVYTWNR